MGEGPADDVLIISEVSDTTTSTSKPEEGVSASGSTWEETKEDEIPESSQTQAISTTQKVSKDKKKSGGKSSVEQPAKLFSVENAKGRAAGYLKTALERVQNHPIFSGKYPSATSVITLVASLLLATDSEDFCNYSTTLVAALWVIASAGDDKFLQPEAMDIVWKKFHEFKLSTAHLDNWKSFVNSVGNSSDGSHVNIVYQHILLTIITLLIKDRHVTDLPATSLNNQETLSKEEEQVLRYVAGYVPFALCQKFSKQLNDTAAIFCKILATWRSCTTNSEKTFLESSNEWVQLQNRGGLFIVNDDVYIFFRTLENEARPFLSKGNLESCVGRNV
jgi:coiled-coil and C2 domain-containing protein 1